MSTDTKQIRRMAQRQFQHWHPIWNRSRETRESCGACALLGYEPRGAGWHVAIDGPNYAGWARVYVQAGRAVPSRWYDAFWRERHSDNTAYAQGIESDLDTFGCPNVHEHRMGHACPICGQ